MTSSDIFISLFHVATYNKKLTQVMQSILLVSQVANVAKEIETAGFSERDSLQVDLDSGDGSESEDDGNPDNTSRSLTLTQRTKIMDMVGEWEEPVIESNDKSVRYALQFNTSNLYFLIVVCRILE